MVKKSTKKRLKAFLRLFTTNPRRESRYEARQQERINTLIGGSKKTKKKTLKHQKGSSGIKPINHITTNSSIWTVKKK